MSARYGSTYAGGIQVETQGIDAVAKALAQMDGKPAKTMLQKSATAGAGELRKAVKGRAPVGKTGALKRSVRSGQTKRLRPAARIWLQKDINRTRGKNTTFYRHMVVGGTMAHGPKSHPILAFQMGNLDSPWIYAKHVRGTSPRPFVSQGFDAGQAAAMKAIDKVVDAALAKL
jgi:hypothetical protein